MSYYLLRFGVSLLLTEMLELTAAVLTGLRSRDGLLILLSVNLLTNPLAVLAAELLKNTGAGIYGELCIEAAVILAEWRLFRIFKDSEAYYSKPFRKACLLNIISYAAGLVINAVQGRLYL